MRPYAVLGAGAVGSAMAAYLARSGHPVVVAARAAHAEAIQSQHGIRVLARNETFLAPVTAQSHLPENLPEDTIVFLTVKAPDVEVALDGARALCAAHPVVTWQNGVRSEHRAASRCPRLYGGIVRFTATSLHPGEVRLRTPGQLILGNAEGGSDSLVHSMVADLNRAGFTAAASPDIRVEKALKLLVNLVSGPAVLIARTGPEPALALVQSAILDEAYRVFDAAGIQAAPLSGLGQTRDALIAQFRAGGSAPDTSGGVYNSTWQNLHHRRAQLENEEYHGEILRLGGEHHIPTPVNARALELLTEAHVKQLGPEPYSPAAFQAAFADLIDFSTMSTTPPPDPPRGLEL